jgi:hypothetical protein
MFVYDGYWALVSAPHMFPTDRYLREKTGPGSWYVDRPRCAATGRASTASA